jgi:hypothetical protein
MAGDPRQESRYTEHRDAKNAHSGMTVLRKQKTENRKQKTENRKQKTKNRYERDNQ